MKIIIFFTIFLLILHIFPAKKEVNFLKLANCKEYKGNLTLTYRNVVFTRNRQGKAISLRMQAIFKKEVKRLMVAVTLMKCDNSGNLDTCEYYMKDFKVKNICDIMGRKNQLWTEALSKTNYNGRCPIDAGMYYLNDSSLDTDMQLTLVPIPVALWKIRCSTYDSGNDDVLVGCADLDVNVYTARRN